MLHVAHREKGEKTYPNKNKGQNKQQGAHAVENQKNKNVKYMCSVEFGES